MRTRAFKLSLAHLALLVPATVAFQLVFLVTSELTKLAGIPWLYTVVSIMLMVALCPFSLGMTAICIRIWRGEAVSFNQFFAYYTDRSRLGRLFGLGVVIAILPQLALAPISLMQSANYTSVVVAISVILFTPLFMLFYMWIELRLFATGYIFATTEGIDPLRCIPASFSFMRRRCWRLFGFNLSIGIVPALLIILLLVPVTLFTPAATGLSPATTTTMQLLLSICTPYLNVASAGYFLDVMLNTPVKPPKGKMQVQDIYHK